MAGTIRVAEGNTLIRRFDPTDTKRCTHDDAGQPAKLKGYAFKWDDEQEDAPIRKECSVYEQEKLADAGLGPWDCVEELNPHWHVAEALAGKVTTFIRAFAPDEPNPFDAFEDLFPNGSPPPHDRDAAHAVIAYTPPLKGDDKWFRELALRFKPLPKPESEMPPTSSLTMSPGQDENENV
jgi:hypothetical protein